MADKENLATTGTESYKIADSKAADVTNASGLGVDLNKLEREPIVLNIEADEFEGLPFSQDKSSYAGRRGLFTRINSFLMAHSGVKVKDKASFFHLLSVMINSGMPMVKALRSLVVQMHDRPRLKLIIEDIANRIESGSSLSEAMLSYPKVFAESEIGMVESGEASGQLAKVLDNVAKDAEKAYMIKAKVKGAMIYPAVIFSLLILVVVGLMVYVVPEMKKLFLNTGGELPLITRVVVGISDFMADNILLLLLGVVLLVVGFIGFKKTASGRYLFDKFKLGLPIFGELLKKAYLSRFARSLSNLLDSNVTIVSTLEITANSIGNEVYRKRLLWAMEDIKQGIPLAENLSASELFPPILVNMIDVGEKTAQLDEIMAKVAVFYEEELDAMVGGLSKLIEPIILMVLGGLVGVVGAAVFFPLFNLADNVGG